MSAIGDPVRRNTTASDLFRSVLNEINEIKSKLVGGKVLPLTLYIIDIGKVLLSHTEPIISTTTNLRDTYDSATSAYDVSEYL